MPPHNALATPLRAWRCPQCTRRAFSTGQPSRAVGPEHPRYIDVPEAPQQTVPYHPPVKGTLPIPRNLLAGAGKKDKGSVAWAEEASKRPLKQVKHAKGSREEWKVKMTESRRRNLKEGLQSIKARNRHEHLQERARNAARSEKLLAAREAPEREDERLTTPTHGLDLETLLNKAPQDPHRDARLAHKRANVAQHESLRSAERLNNLHTLYMNARSFIVTPEQLDEAVDEAFGTDANPVTFGYKDSKLEAAQSVWGQGKPMSVEDMLLAAQGKGRAAVQLNSTLEMSRQRMRKVAEELTGGTMEE